MYFCWQNHKELTVHWTVVEIILIFLYLLTVGIIRIIPRYLPSIQYTTAKFIMCLGLIYFYYRTMNIYFPISPVLGPMLISIKRMVKPLKFRFKKVVKECRFLICANRITGTITCDFLQFCEICNLLFKKKCMYLKKNFF